VRARARPPGEPSGAGFAEGSRNRRRGPRAVERGLARGRRCAWRPQPITRTAVIWTARDYWIPAFISAWISAAVSARL
jgi:hypothetical protein